MPFDVVDDSPGALEAFQIPPLKVFFADLKRADLVLDVGCGAGRNTIYLHRRGIHTVALELSAGSLRTIQSRVSAPLVQASNLNLPVKPGSVDAVISDGVLPYTDDPVRCLRENLATLKLGGRMFLALYKPDNYYYYLYTYVGAVFRFVYRLPVGRIALHSTAVAAYHFLRNNLRRSRRSSWSRSKALFYDYFLAPRIRFYSRDQVLGWIDESGARCLSYDRCPGWNAHAFILEKPRQTWARPVSPRNREAETLTAAKRTGWSP